MSPYHFTFPTVLTGSFNVYICNNIASLHTAQYLRCSSICGRYISTALLFLLGLPISTTPFIASLAKVYEVLPILGNPRHHLPGLVRQAATRALHYPLWIQVAGYLRMVCHIISPLH